MDEEEIVRRAKRFWRGLSLWQRLRLRLFGCVYLRHERRKGWSGPLPIYLIKCTKHGLFEDYPHGYSGRFDCPKCLKEAQKK